MARVGKAGNLVASESGKTDGCLIKSSFRTKSKNLDFILVQGEVFEGFRAGEIYNPFCASGRFL